MKSAPRVMLLIESSRGYGRGCLQGVANYARIHGPWTFLHVERGLEEKLPTWLGDWKPDGIISRIENQALGKSLLALKAPVVDLRGKLTLSGVAALDTDPYATAKAAVDHFWDRGFRHFGFCGYPGLNFSDQRCGAFVRIVADMGRGASIFEPAAEQRTDGTLKQEAEGALHETEIAQWLGRLPRPLAVMACNDARGRQVLDACAQHGLRVPEEVAVIGVDNDEVLCDLSNPPLSSVEPDTMRLGYLGAEILHRMLRGGKAPKTVRLVPPRGVATRLSTDILAIDDPIVAEAMHIIRQHACSGLNVEGLLDHLTISRATLERRFTKHLGRSPKDELQRLRLQKAQELLRETGYPLTRIAEMTGFRTAAHLSVAFKLQLGQSPGQFRTNTGNSKGSGVAVQASEKKQPPEP